MIIMMRRVWRIMSWARTLKWSRAEQSCRRIVIVGVGGGGRRAQRWYTPTIPVLALSSPLHRSAISTFPRGKVNIWVLLLLLSLRLSIPIFHAHHSAHPSIRLFCLNQPPPNLACTKWTWKKKREWIYASARFPSTPPSPSPSICNSGNWRIVIGNWKLNWKLGKSESWNLKWKWKIRNGHSKNRKWKWWKWNGGNGGIHIQLQVQVERPNGKPQIGNMERTANT